MERKRVAFVVEVDLDPVPGTMYTVESAEQVVLVVLLEVISHYNPRVSLAPDVLQPKTQAEI